MSRKTTPRETEKPKKLTRAQKKEIDAVLRKYKGDGKPRTAQATIPYEAIYPDGVCRIDRRTFSKCIAFEDISYQLAQPETRTAIFEHAEKVNGVWEQRLRIHYNCVGTIEIPSALPLPTPDVSVNTRKGVVVNYAPCDVAI